ncbi:MAG: hypothetical protein CBC13_09845 [Planctomycetia bacterium TMED53]|nr:MAG: hypothetical protein CBC13_09845 [Planctomycetia bacterium TMED53]
MNSHHESPSGKATLSDALDLRLKGGAAEEAIMGPIAIDAESVADHIERHRHDPEKRNKWFEALRPTWEAMDLSAGSKGALAKLQDPDCRVVMTGQQPALWGGPLLCMMKLLAATRLVADLEGRGIPAVALFWIADDDHDTGELDPGWFRSRSKVINPFPRGKVPISSLSLSEEQESATERLRAAIEAAPAASDLLKRIDDEVSSVSSPSQQFVKILQMLAPDESWLPVFPKLLRTLQWPWIERAAKDTSQFQSWVSAASDEQLAQGIPAPVKVRGGAPFFFVDSAGERVRPEKSKEYSQENLIELKDRLSADALLRSVVQDGIFEPAAVVLGVTEWCYTLQTREVRRAWQVSQPLWLPRPSLRPLEAELVEHFRELGVSVERLSPELDIANVIPSPRGQLKGLELDQAVAEILQRLKELEDGDMANPALRRRARRLSLQWQRQLEALKVAIDHGLDRDVEARRHRLRDMLQQAFPSGKEQERCRNLLDLVAWHGEEVISQAKEQITAAITRWDGAVKPWILPSLNVTCEEEDSDATPS